MELSSTFGLFGGFLLGVLLTLGILSRRDGRFSLRSFFQKAGGSSQEPSPDVPAEPFDEVAAARELLDAEEDLRGLYRRLGFSLGFEQRAQAILEEIKAGIVVEIPDYEAFRASVEAALGSEDRGAEDLQAKARLSRKADPLFAAVAAAPDEATALVALRRAPVDEVLPFVEEVPLARGGAVVWRTPMGLDVLHKRAADPAALLRRLEELVQRIEASALRRQPKPKAELLKAAAALRQAVEGGQTYLVTPIKTLEAKLAEWYLAPEDAAARQRRRRLDELLLMLVRLRHEADREELVSAALLRERATALAQSYVSNPALHTPRLSQLLLQPLLAAEASAARGKEPGKPLKPEDPARLLDTVAREVRSGRFDGEESLRRLRSLEPRGLFVHSLVYRLLEMAAPPAKVL